MNNPDLLTNLPTSIIADILGRVPIREAIRTSVLSTQWRYIWYSIPNLVFIESCVKQSNNNVVLDEADNNAFVTFIYRVLLLHQGPVHSFKINVDCCPEFSDINQWLTFVSRNGVEELSLGFGSFSKAPSSLLQCSKLVKLRLYRQRLELPGIFEGFKSLKDLSLCSVTISIRSLEKLVSRCPLLEILVLFRCHSTVLKIQAPLLKSLRLHSKFEGFILKKTPLLEEISVTITNAVTEHRRTHIQFIDQVPLLKKFVGLNYFTKCWNVGEDPTMIAITHNHLRFIELSIDFEDPSEVCLLMRLLSRSPVLKELEIRVARRGRSPEGPVCSQWEVYSEAHDLGCQLLQLKKVMVTNSGSRNEIEFIEFVLLNLPALETLTVSTPQNESTNMLVRLLKCRRASSKDEVVFCKV